MWAKYVDGFRCDVAPLVPVAFWKRARKEVAQVRPGAIWLAESVDPGFIRMSRSHGMECASDAELYQAFDICYDYAGIEMWATDQWKTNNPLTRQYADYMKRMNQKIVISFHKVAAHTGVEYNEMADRIAKEAIGI